VTVCEMATDRWTSSGWVSSAASGADEAAVCRCQRAISADSEARE